MKIKPLHQLRIKAKRFIGSKKGFLASPLADMWSFILFVLIAIIFLILFMITKSGIKLAIENQSGRVNAENDFLIYLRLPINLNKQQLNPLELSRIITIDEFKSKSGTNYIELQKASENYLKSLEFSNLPANTCFIYLELEMRNSSTKSASRTMLATKQNPDFRCRSETGTFWNSRIKVPAEIGAETDYSFIFSLGEGKNKDVTR